MNKFLKFIFVFLSIFCVFLFSHQDKFFSADNINITSTICSSQNQNTLSLVHQSSDIYISLPSNSKTEISNQSNKNKNLGLILNNSLLFNIHSLKYSSFGKIFNCNYIVHITSTILEHVINSRAP